MIAIKLAKSTRNTTRQQDSPRSSVSTLTNTTRTNPSLKKTNSKLKVKFSYSLADNNLCIETSTALTTKKRNSFNRMNQHRSQSLLIIPSKKQISIINISNIAKKQKKYCRTTLVLLSISSTFLVLNFPLALFKIYNYYFSKSKHIEGDTLKENDLMNNTAMFYDGILRNLSVDFMKLFSTKH